MVIVIFSNGLIGLYYESTSNKNIVAKHITQRFNDFYKLPENTLDLIFIGSSHSYTTFDPEIFDSRLNINSFQMGAPAQQADSTYYELLEILNYQQPKIIVYEYYWNVLRAEPELGQAKTVMSFLKTPELRESFSKESLSLIQENQIKYAFKTIRYQQDFFAYMSSLLSEKITQLKKNDTLYYRSKGFVYCDSVISEAEYGDGNHFKNTDGTHIELNKNQLVYLQKIIELCKNNEIELIFVTAPLANVTMERHIKNYDNIHKVMLEFAHRSDIKYIDYNLINQEENILENKNFMDDNHLNYSGAVIVSNHFADWINANNILN